ncbi:hypothetical protein R2601_25441 [Salipiger bermudensis HTCC2601]|uniref:Uncharacterized protein n=1 Tax=Salipiger bermudensis (strain DSM 26914 / JCM 13377 / KCTC 12554 / HTCC2601) TaxID=314265 RepID=Q0FPV0_SALBH|nr:hypothetical protein R2601_25441 [Salipiger bermudensis HTCC2601]
MKSLGLLIWQGPLAHMRNGTGSPTREVQQDASLFG